MKLFRIIGIFVLLAFLTGCTLVNQLRLRNSNDHLEPIWNDNATLSSLKTEYDGEKPYIYVSINGIDNFKMLVDTGASITILQDTDKVKALGLKRGYDLALSGWGDEEDSPAFQSELSNIALGQANFNEVNIAYLPTSLTKYFLRADEAVYDGVIGHDLMKHFNWKFDKRDNHIQISSTQFKVPESTVTLPIDTFFSKLYIESTIDMGNNQVLDRELIIDTGSRHYLKLNNTYMVDNDIKLPGTSITAVDFGLSGRATHQRITVPSLSLADLTIDNVKANVIKSDEDDDFWIVGSALLNQYISIVDYQNERLHLIAYPNTEFRTRYNLLGLELRKTTGGEFVVRYLFPDIVSDEAGIKEGDLITRIDGKNSQEITLEDWLDITNTIGEHELCWQRQELVCRILIAKPVVGYSVGVD